MHHLKCDACTVRLRAAATGDECDLCPVCGSLMDRVTDPKELVGYRAISTNTEHSPTGKHKLLADRIGDMMVRRDARAIGTRWADEADSGDDSAAPLARTAALPVPSLDL